MSNECKQCGYEFNTLYKGFCEYCRDEYGKQKGRYSQSEQKKVFSDSELEDMTDGDFFNEFGHTHIQWLRVDKSTKTVEVKGEFGE